MPTDHRRANKLRHIRRHLANFINNETLQPPRQRKSAFLNCCNQFNMTPEMQMAKDLHALIDNRKREGSSVCVDYSPISTRKYYLTDNEFNTFDQVRGTDVVFRFPLVLYTRMEYWEDGCMVLHCQTRNGTPERPFYGKEYTRIVDLVSSLRVKFALRNMQRGGAIMREEKQFSSGMRCSMFTVFPHNYILQAHLKNVNEQ
jgi:hypothetical protein